MPRKNNFFNIVFPFLQKKKKMSEKNKHFLQKLKTTFKQEKNIS